MATPSMTLDTPIRVSSSLDADETRRLLAIVSSRVSAQFRNIETLANRLNVDIASDPADPIRNELQAAGGVVKAEAGLAISLSSLPTARLQSGWLVATSGDEPRRIPLRAIAGGPYFPGIHMLTALVDSLSGLTVDPYYGGIPTSDSTVAGWQGSSVNATRDNVHTLLAPSGPVRTAIYWLREYVNWFTPAVRSGASRSQG